MEKYKFDSEAQNTVSTWNINGSARAWMRKRVTTDTFNLQQYQDGTTLGQSDIICVQEMTTKPGGLRGTDQQYLPFASDYGVVSRKEPTGNVYNAVYFNQEKFSQVDDECLTQAYNLMDIKKRCYDYIQQGGDERKVKAIDGQLSVPARFDKVKRKIFEEVLNECEEAECEDTEDDKVQAFNRKISKFRAPGETETKYPSDLIKRRAAICVLESESLPEDNIIVVASVHNYSRRSGVGAPENYASLLFDFLSKLPSNITIIIAGDFNFDILACRDPSLTQYLPSYHIPRYELRPLRSRSRTIDFIVVSKTKPKAELQVSVPEVQAHDLQVNGEVDDEIEGDHSKITNHSPVSAVIELKLNDTVFDVHLHYWKNLCEKYFKKA
jgi:hypothetical protein